MGATLEQRGLQGICRWGDEVDADLPRVKSVSKGECTREAAGEMAGDARKQRIAIHDTADSLDFNQHGTGCGDHKSAVVGLGKSRGKAEELQRIKECLRGR